MPGFDQTGPRGGGPMTGGGFGRCGARDGRGYGGRGQRYRWFQQRAALEPTPMADIESAPASAQLTRLAAALESIEARLARIEGERS
ncbi:MAG: DUF5320 family protein [Pseudomonadota bacterium]